MHYNCDKRNLLYFYIITRIVSDHLDGSRGEEHNIDTLINETEALFQNMLLNNGVFLVVLTRLKESCSTKKTRLKEKLIGPPRKKSRTSRTSFRHKYKHQNPHFHFSVLTFSVEKETRMVAMKDQHGKRKR